MPADGKLADPPPPIVSMFIERLYGPKAAGAFTLLPAAWQTSSYPVHMRVWTENILRGSGRGIFLIRAFMDEVNFRQLHPGTELTLIKHRTPAQSGT